MDLVDQRRVCDRLDVRGAGEQAAEPGGDSLAVIVAVAEQVEPRLVGPDQGIWLDRLELEHDNLRSALSFCLEARLEARGW